MIKENSIRVRREVGGIKRRVFRMGYDTTIVSGIDSRSKVVVNLNVLLVLFSEMNVPLTEIIT